MIIVDASAWVVSLLDSGPTGSAARSILTQDQDWAAPAHAPIEVLRTLRRYEERDVLEAEAADRYAQHVLAADLRIFVADRTMLSFVWEQRKALSPYDAPYVGLSLRYDVTLVTCDLRLARGARPLGAEVVVPGEL